MTKPSRGMGVSAGHHFAAQSEHPRNKCALQQWARPSHCTPWGAIAVSGWLYNVSD